MPRINLLPWRTELRQKRKQEFLTVLLGAVIAAAVVVYGAKLTAQGWVRAQQDRNRILTEEIALLDQQIAEIAQLETKRDRLLARMTTIDQLQRSRPDAVHLVDEFVEVLPPGLHLTEIVQSGTQIQVKGAAQSNSRVARLLEAIDASDWLKDYDLGPIEQKPTGANPAEFRLSVKQVTLAEPADGAAGAEGAAQ